MAYENHSSAWGSYGLDQAVVEGWVRRTFGDKIMDNPKERATRVLEEALELSQAMDVPREEVLRLVAVIYDHPVGEVPQEIGGLIVTLLALCAHRGVRLDDLAQREIARITLKDREDFRKRQDAKADLGVADRPE